jgi:hypothetical protein
MYLNEKSARPALYWASWFVVVLTFLMVVSVVVGSHLFVVMFPFVKEGISQSISKPAEVLNISLLCFIVYGWFNVYKSAEQVEAPRLAALPGDYQSVWRNYIKVDKNTGRLVTFDEFGVPLKCFDLLSEAENYLADYAKQIQQQRKGY